MDKCIRILFVMFNAFMHTFGMFLSLPDIFVLNGGCELKERARKRERVCVKERGGTDQDFKNITVVSTITTQKIQDNKNFISETHLVYMKFQTDIAIFIYHRAKHRKKIIIKMKIKKARKQTSLCQAV